MHDAVNNVSIMDCYCYGGALSLIRKAMVMKAKEK